MSGVHPEDMHAYALQTHDDLAAIAAELAGIRELLALLCGGERAITIRQSGAFITREDRP